MEMLRRRLFHLLTVKSIVTIMLTGVFAYLAVAGHVSTEQYLTVFTVVIAFYFGTQAERENPAEQSGPSRASAAGEDPRHQA